MGDLTCSFTEFKGRCKELIDAAPDLDNEGIQNGVRMLNLSYMSMEATELEVHMAAIALQLTLIYVGAIERMLA